MNQKILYTMNHRDEGTLYSHSHEFEPSKAPFSPSPPHADSNPGSANILSKDWWKPFRQDSFLSHRWPMFRRWLCGNQPLASEECRAEYCYTISQKSPGFYVSVTQVFRKHCGNRRNCSLRAIFLFSTVFFYHFGDLFAIFINFKIVVCKLSQYGRVQNLSFGKGLKEHQESMDR